MKLKLKKELKLIDTFCISLGAMISSGLFVLPAIAFAKSGPSVIVAYAIASLFVVPALLSKAELVTAMPKTGGTYFFIDRTLGPVAGIFGGLINWFSLSLKSAFALMGMGVFAVLIYPSIGVWETKIVAVAFCLLFTFTNFVSVRITGRLQTSLVLSLIAMLVIYVLSGSGHIVIQRYTPFMPYGFGSCLATAGLVFISFGGLTKIASIAEEVENPSKNLPLGMFLAFLTATILYVAVVFITVGLVDATALNRSLTPISLGAEISLGSPGVILMAIAAIIAFVTTANSGMLSASRFPLAMSQSQLLPDFFKKINVQFKTPHSSIIVTSVFMICSILFLNLEDLIKTASTLKIILFIFVNISVILMRESQITTYRPTFRSPLYPWVQIAGIILPAILILEMGKTALFFTGSFIAASLLWYMFYARFRVDRRSALAHVIERITAKELAAPTLHDELCEILFERDNIVADRFDRMIKKSEILDLDESPTMEEAFEMVSMVMSTRLGLDKDRLYHAFVERENEASTILSPALAVPHIIVEGTQKFDIVLVRCKKGIRFPNTRRRVRTMFVLASSIDERAFHLRALAAIAQIAQDKKFSRHWLRARSIEELRNIVLLAERKRMAAA